MNATYNRNGSVFEKAIYMATTHLEATDVASKDEIVNEVRVQTPGVESWEAAENLVDRMIEKRLIVRANGETEYYTTPALSEIGF